MYTNNLKAYYIEFLTEEARALSRCWEMAHEDRKFKKARKFMAFWQMVDDELSLIADQPSGIVAKYIIESRDSNPLCTELLYRTWGYNPNPEPLYTLAAL